MMRPTEPVRRERDDGALEYYRAAQGVEWVLGGALLVGTIAVVVLSRGADVVERLSTWPWAGWWLGLLALPPVAFVVGAAARRPVPRLGMALDVGLFLWALVAVVGAWFAASRPTAMNAALLPLSTICLAYVVRGWLGFDPVLSRRRVCHALTVLGLALALVLATVWWVPGPVTQGRESAAVGLAAMALPLFAGLGLGGRGLVRLAWLLAAASAAGFVVLMGELAGACAVGAIILCGGLASIATRRMPRIGWCAVVLGMVVVTGFNVSAWTPDRAAMDAETLAAREQSALIKLGAAMGADRVWLGQGPGMVAWHFPDYAARFSIVADEVSALPSTPVQVWAEHGILGVLAMLSLGLGVGLRAWRLRPGGLAADAGTHDDRVRAWSVVCALGAGGGFALAEYPLDAPPLLAVLAALLPMLSALTRPVGDARVSWSPTFLRVVPAVAVAAALALIGWHVWPGLQARRVFAEGLSAAVRGDSAGFESAVRQARAQTGWDPAYPEALARHFVREAVLAGDTPRASNLRGLAIGQFKQAIATRPGQLAARLELGALLLAANEPASAAEIYRTAVDLAPNHREARHQLGRAWLRAGNTREAIDTFALEWILHPQSVMRPEWTGAELGPIRDEVATSAMAGLAVLVREARPDVATVAAKLADVFAHRGVRKPTDSVGLLPDGWLSVRERERVVRGGVQ